ncbi:MAG: phosphatidate cytidylyltransferase [Pirellulales bacterium]|nr:phosphatidate cytidylyltransferase [Pirellulales bacterium]
MGWPALPAEVLWALASFVALLAACTAVAQFFARSNRAKDYSELNARIRTWWWIVALLALALLSGQAGAVGFFAFVSLLAFREFVTVVPTRDDDRTMRVLAYTAIPLQYYWAYTDWYGLFIIFIPVYALLAMPAVAILAGRTTGFIHAASALHWGLMITTFSISHAAYLLALTPGQSPRVEPQWPSAAAEHVPGLGLVVLLIALTELNDVAQYVWGKTLGRRRIVPRISPNKTVAGFLGGVATTVATAAVLGPLLTPMDWGHSLAAGALVAIAGFAGDLTMSMLKRDLGVKDTGHSLPGHGGVLDRIDSLSFTAPLFFHYVYFYFF